MQIVEFRAELLPDLTRLINEQLAAIPPCWTLSETQVALTIAQAGSLWGMHYPEDQENYTSPTVCVLEKREIVAAAQWLVPSEGKNVCSICWIVARPEYPIAVRTPTTPHRKAGALQRIRDSRLRAVFVRHRLARRSGTMDARRHWNARRGLPAN